MEAAVASILVVDDTPANLQLLGNMLKQNGYDIRLVPKGSLAVASAQTEPPDLILLDIKMPEMNGYEVCKLLKADNRTSTIPIIFISVLQDPIDKVNALALGGVDYITKPFYEEEVLARIEAQLNLRRLQVQLEKRNAELLTMNYKLQEEIIEREQAETNLKKTEEQCRTIIEYCADAIFLHDFNGNIVQVNRVTCENIGYSQDELLAMNMKQIECPSEEIGVVPPPYSTDPVVFETVYQKKNGLKFPVEVHRTPIRFTEENLIVSFARDIKTRKEKDEEAQRVKKLESLATFSGGLAHDFNNLLFIVSGNTSLLEEEVQHTETAAGYFQEINSAIRRASDLTRELIVFAKGGDPVKEISSLGALIHSSPFLVDIGPEITFDIRITDDLWLVEFDKKQLTQVLKNLIVNAAEAMPEGGKISISAGNIDLNLERKLSNTLSGSNFVEIVIQDEGTGIKTEHQSLIFDPYFSTKSRGIQKGMGLGLATAYAIIKKHNGHIIAQSEPSKGSRFSIYLPALHKLTIETAVLAENRKPTMVRGKKILVMDDESMIRTMLQAFLNHFGYTAITTQEGSEALETYQQAMTAGSPFDAVILDLTIKEGMDGKETMEKLIALDPEVKAIISSGYYHDPVLAEYKNYGFKGAIPKPYNIKKLKEILTKILGE